MLTSTLSGRRRRRPHVHDRCGSWIRCVIPVAHCYYLNLTLLNPPPPPRSWLRSGVVGAQTSCSTVSAWGGWSDRSPKFDVLPSTLVAPSSRFLAGFTTKVPKYGNMCHNYHVYIYIYVYIYMYPDGTCRLRVCSLDWHFCQSEKATHTGVREYRIIDYVLMFHMYAGTHKYVLMFHTYSGTHSYKCDHIPHVFWNTKICALVLLFHTYSGTHTCVLIFHTFSAIRYSWLYL
jgi:hypothetical protein